MSQPTCGDPVCRAEWKRQCSIAKAKRIEIRKRKEKLKTLRDWIKDAQVAFNAYVRERDSSRPCISCGKFAASWDAGHYRTTAAAPELRFDEDNVHRQCVQCNQHKHGNVVEYRIRLIERIGLARVERLEGPHEPKRYTRDEVVEIRDFYVAKLKDLKRSAA